MDTFDFSRYDYTVEETEQHLYKCIRSTCSITHAPLVFEALDIVRHIYSNQQRDDLIPSMLHPMRVALMLAQFDDKTTSKLLVAALLHDTMKDGRLTNAAIEAQFGHFVSKLVTAVTRYSHTSCIPGTQQIPSPVWQEILLDNHEVRSIKVFEEVDNMIYWKYIPADHPARLSIPCWLEEVRAMYFTLAHATNKQAYNLMRQEYAYYVEHGYTYQPESVTFG
jgi:(p)ppGpp synthase/HD superfamily hydrolase